jgi:GNAT superfamily N-acetyltransferase
MIRLGTPNDFPAINAFDPFAGDRQLELSTGSILIAEIDSQVIAYVTFTPTGFIGRPFIHFLAVTPAFRRQGIATNLLRAVATRIGPNRLFISTEEGNTPMLQLLKKDGWTNAGCVHHVNDNGSPECFFYREIAPA